MRAITCILVLALVASSRAATIVDCSTLNPAVANGGKCTSSSDTPASSPVTCATGYFIVKGGTAAAPTYSCSNTVSAGACPALAPYTTVGGQSPPTGTCAAGQPNVPANSDAASTYWTAPTATTGTCASTTTGTGANAVTTYYTAGVVAAPVATTAANTPFSTTPGNTWMCYTCPTNCMNCDPKTGNANANVATAMCKTAMTGYYLATPDANGYGTATVCPSAVSSTYGGNATACTACNSATNCTTGTCGTGFDYLSFANVAGNIVAGTSKVNLSALDTTRIGAVQGCYNLSYINSTYATASTKNANRMMAFSAVIVSVVASIFVF